MQSRQRAQQYRTSVLSIACGFAVKGSVKFVKLMEEILSQAGHAEFWNVVKTIASDDRKEDEYEKFSHFPTQFVDAGPRPKEGADNNGCITFLRY